MLGKKQKRYITDNVLFLKTKKKLTFHYEYTLNSSVPRKTIFLHKNRRENDYFLLTCAALVVSGSFRYSMFIPPPRAWYRNIKTGFPIATEHDL